MDHLKPNQPKPKLREEIITGGGTEMRKESDYFLSVLCGERKKETLIYIGGKINYKLEYRYKFRIDEL